MLKFLEPSRPQPPGMPRRFRLPIATVLVVGFGMLMLVAVASVLAIGTGVGVSNIFSLLQDKAQLALDNVQIRLRHQLDPVADQADFLAARILSGDLDTSDPAVLGRSLELSLAATPQVTGIGFVSTESMVGTLVARVDGRLVTTSNPVDKNEAEVASLLAESRNRRALHWGDPVWDDEFGASLVTMVRPIHRGDTLFGVLVAGVSLHDLSRFLSDLYVEDGIRAFVLYDRNYVLAHPNLTRLDLDFSGSEGPPLPRIGEVGDPVLAGIWDDDRKSEAFGEITVTAPRIDDGDDDYILLTRPTTGYGSRPWMIGIMFSDEEATAELERFGIAAAVGLGILLISVGAALMIGIPVSRKIRRLASAANALAALDFKKVPALPDSRLQEFAYASAAVNSMVAGLRWFETYVPKTLVARLMNAGNHTELTSDERDITVMFTDIRGFSTLAERMSASDTAQLLNAHFAALAGCIEAENGTVDKFIGDAVMAFWGAPEDQPDHAARALRAAMAIDRAVRVDNMLRRRQGRPALQVRIALYTGPVVVGNIGSPSRINYTIVGETVNTASRIEALASSLHHDGEECLILAGATTVSAAGGSVPATSIGRRALRGITDTIEIFQVGQPAAAVT